MKKGILTIALLALSNVVVAANDFEGTYKCHGHDPYLNKDYSGTVIITQQNTVYSLDMRYDTGEYERGTGGPYNQTLLSVVFQDTKDLKTVGLEQYTFSADKKSIGGFWVYLGKDKLGTESCERVERKI